MSIYYTNEARKSTISRIEELIGKIGEIPGTYLDYLSAREVVNYLVDYKRQVEKELKENSLKFKREPELLDSNGFVVPITEIGFFSDSSPEDLFIAIEKSNSVSALVSNIDKVKTTKKFYLESVSPFVVRLKSSDSAGNTYTLKIKKISV